MNQVCFALLILLTVLGSSDHVIFGFAKLSFNLNPENIFYHLTLFCTVDPIHLLCGDAYGSFHSECFCVKTDILGLVKERMDNFCVQRGIWKKIQLLHTMVTSGPKSVQLFEIPTKQNGKIYNNYALSLLVLKDADKFL